MRIGSGSDTIDELPEQPVVFIGAGEEPEGYQAPAAEEPAAKDKKADETDERITRLEADLKDERSRRQESDRNAQAWAARATTREPAEPKPAVVEEATEDIDLVDALSSGNKAQAAKALKGLGFYTKDEVDSMVREQVANGVSAARQEVSVEQLLVDEYPDLRDDDSDLFIETQAEARRLKKRGLDGDLLIETAANAAAARLGVVRKSLISKKGKKEDEPAPRDTTRRRAAREDERDERDEESEEERTTRVASQSRRPGRNAPTSDAGAEELSPSQKRMAKLFGISEDKYKLRAKRGVNLSGVLED